MKKLTRALLGAGLLLSCNAFAFSPDCTGCGYLGGLSAPKNAGGFFIGGTGYWLKATGNGSDLATESVLFGANPTLSGLANFFNPLNATSVLKPYESKYRFAWGINLGYDLPCSANSVEAEYFHLENNYITKGDQADGANGFSSNTLDITEPFENLLHLSNTQPIFFHDFSSHGHVRFKFEELDVKFARTYVDACGHFKFHPAVGVRFARLEENRLEHIITGLVQAFPAPPTPITINFSGDFDILDNFRSKFHGVGPVVSFDVRYGFCGGFGIVGHFDSSLLTAKLSGDRHYVSTLTPTQLIPNALPVVTADQQFNSPKKDRFVASMGGRVGLDYGFCLCDKSSINLELGFKASRYFKAIQNVQGSVALPGFLFQNSLLPSEQSVTDVRANDFDFFGPYFNATWHI